MTIKICWGSDSSEKAIAALGIGAVAVSVSSINASALEKGTVTASALNIRSGPSSDCDKVAKLYKGKTVEILEKSNGWYKVRVSSSVVGWEVQNTYQQVVRLKVHQVKIIQLQVGQLLVEMVK